MNRKPIPWRLDGILGILCSLTLLLSINNLSIESASQPLLLPKIYASHAINQSGFALIIL